MLSISHHMMMKVFERRWNSKWGLHGATPKICRKIHCTVRFSIANGDGAFPTGAVVELDAISLIEISDDNKSYKIVDPCGEPLPDEPVSEPDPPLSQTRQLNRLSLPQNPPKKKLLKHHSILPTLKPPQSRLLSPLSSSQTPPNPLQRRQSRPRNLPKSLHSLQKSLAKSRHSPQNQKPPLSQIVWITGVSPIASRNFGRDYTIYQ